MADRRILLLGAFALALLGDSVPAAAQVPAAPYAARGPGWTLTLDGARIRFRAARGRTRLDLAAPPPQRDGAHRRYETPALTIEVAPGPCVDRTTRRRYPDQVELRVRGRTLRGCGGAALLGSAAALQGEWSVETVNARATFVPASLAVRGTHLSGNTGCNAFAGDFRFDRGMLTAGPLATTRRACLDGSGAQERALLELFEAPLSVGNDGGGRLVLRNAAGEGLTLRRER